MRNWRHRYSRYIGKLTALPAHATAVIAPLGIVRSYDTSSEGFYWKGV